MTNRGNESESNDVIDENVMPGTGSRNEADLQYRLASERNRRRWDYEEMYEKDAIQSYINEGDTTKQHRSISQAVKMSEIVLNIQNALCSGLEHDVPKAIENLEKLLKEPFTTMSLLYAPNIVKAVYLCCRYTKSGEVRALAEKCYKRFEPCFGVPYGETFETAFQTEVRELWETQDSITFGATKCDWRHFTMDDEDAFPEIGGLQGQNIEEMDIMLEPSANESPSPEIGGIKGQSIEEMDIKLEPSPNESPSPEIGGIKGQNIEKMDEELEHSGNEPKIKVENIKLESKVDKSLVKREIKQELTDNKGLIQKIEVKKEYSDDKNQVKKEIKVECKVETDNQDDIVACIKKEDPDDTEITYCNV